MPKKAKKKKSAKKPKPRPNGKLGRDSKGKFAKGNSLSKGNLGNTNEPAKKLKQALIDAISEKDIEDIAKKLVTKAKTGDIPAIKELFDRLWGRSSQSVEVFGAEGGPIPVTIIDYSKVNLAGMPDDSNGPK